LCLPAKSDESLRGALSALKRRAEAASSDSDVRALAVCVPVLVKYLSVATLSVECVRELLEALLALLAHGDAGAAPAAARSANAARLALARHSAQYGNSEALLHADGAVAALLSAANSSDLYVRFSVTQLLALLVANHGEAMQRAVVQTQQAVPQLMNLLADTRDLIRNEALLLMIELTAHNQEIQKIAAFEGAFDRLFDIAAADEERTNGRGSTVTHDCLQLVCTLLRGNVSNQNFFRETSCVQRIPPLLTLADSEQRVLSESKHRTLELALELVTLLVAGNNSATPKNQSALARAGTLALLLHLALGGVGSPLVRIKALQALGGLLRGHQGNTARFNQSFLARSGDQREPSLIALVMAALSASSLGERRAALAAFGEYLHENEADQLAIVDSACWPSRAPSSAPPSAGQMLVGVLLKRDAWAEDPYRTWFGACALVCVLRDNVRAKRVALQRPLVGDAGPSLIMRLRDTLIAGAAAAPRVLVGLLRLSIAAAVDSPAIGAALVGFTWEDAGASTLVESRALPALVSLVTAGRVDAGAATAAPAEADAVAEERRTHVRGCAALLLSLVLTLTAPTTKSNAAAPEGSVRATLLSLIKHRLGADQLLSILATLRRTPDFAEAERAPLVSSSSDAVVDDASDQKPLYYDSAFVAAFKEICEEVEHQLRYPTQQRRRPIAAPPSPAAVAAAAPAHVEPAVVVAAAAPAAVAAAAPTVAQSVAQQPQAETRADHTPPPPRPPPHPQKQTEEDLMAQYLEMIGTQRREIDVLRAALGSKPTAPAPDDGGAEKAAAREREVAQLRAELTQTRDQLVDARNEVDVLQSRVAERNDIIESLSAPQNNQALLDRIAQLERDLFERDERISALVESARPPAPAPAPVAPAAAGDDGVLKRRVRDLERDLQRAKDEFASLEREQDKLLGDLAQLEIDNTNFRERLRALGDRV
jgi:hypothetical protein